MNILSISNRVPAAERKGDQAVSFFRLTYLARKGHSIEVICFGDCNDPEDKEAKDKLEAFGITVHFVRWSPLEAACNILVAVLRDNIPFQCALYRSSRFRELVGTAARRAKPDVLYCVMIRAAENIKGFEGPLFVELVDSMALNFARRASLSRPILRWILDLEGRRAAAYEKALADMSQRSFVVSEIDRRAISSAKIDVIPLGLDFQQFNLERLSRNLPVIVFTGNMNYQPNADAICWFVSHCWGPIKAAVRGARLVVAGSRPQARVLALRADPAITVTGRVPSMARILNDAAIAIAPMQSGSGMQFKILEAMACGLPVVTTRLGLGDIHAVIGKDLLVADSANAFIKSILRLLGSPKLREQIGHSALTYVQRHHDWDALNARFALAIK